MNDPIATEPAVVPDEHTQFIPMSREQRDDLYQRLREAAAKPPSTEELSQCLKDLARDSAVYTLKRLGIPETEESIERQTAKNIAVLQKYR